MPTYRVTLTKSVTDGLIAAVEVTARSPNHAAEKAIVLDAAGKLSWEFNVADPEGGSPPEIDSVELVPAPAQGRMLAAALLVASLVAWQPASAQYSESEWRNHEQIFRLQQQQEADRNQYQLDQMRQQARDQQRDFDAYQAHQDSLTRHYRSLGD